jgi:hypothetical protein
MNDEVKISSDNTFLAKYICRRNKNTEDEAK